LNSPKAGWSTRSQPESVSRPTSVMVTRVESAFRRPKPRQPPHEPLTTDGRKRQGLDAAGVRAVPDSRPATSYHAHPNTAAPVIAVPMPIAPISIPRILRLSSRRIGM